MVVCCCCWRWYLKRPYAAAMHQQDAQDITCPQAARLSFYYPLPVCKTIHTYQWIDLSVKQKLFISTQVNMIIKNQSSIRCFL